ncbi:hypothetical protein EIN_076110 [Entamoeba invadens IP1]|uniref:EGF-like domain-containing protein n=1 Tax=Entamoeba invadens IP1 TaxID=370355 RepID=A0A0A1TWB2_ENTIV|nr:hypothetical protein EIN_076110 [Entamoeba invadens IP1]ELP84792.1 hypothetical protein EIN_076110 [Entamoeba invadens IP1]|eukprot:XP_004184138.1 hypothetical protein EIN_076110 [Entamoeba invadens IP1]
MTTIFYELLFLFIIGVTKTFGVIDCGKGQYSYGPSCDTCPKGYYCPDGYNMVACLSGTYTPNTGMAYCESCKEGSYSTGGSSECVLCTNETCASCDSTNGNCLTCRAGSGFVGNNKCEKCLPGYYSTGGILACSPCSQNSYSFLGFSSCIACDISCLSCDETNGDCLSCYGGSVITEGRCVPCQAGTYRKGNSCYPCGHNNDDFSLSNSTTCTTCDNCTTCETQTGQCTSCKEAYVVKNGMCLPCASGNFYNKTEKNCQKCPKGTYSSLPGSENCLECPIGSYSDNEGASSCIRCDDSCSENQCIKDSGYCISCSAGSIKNMKICSVCSGGTIANMKTNTCDNCPAGTYSKSRSTECTTCEENTYSLEKSATCNSCSNTCKTCDKTSGKCITCVDGYGLDSSKNCLICTIGTYSLNSKCTECGDGFYQNKDGQNACKQCNSSCTSCNKNNGECIDCKAGYGFEFGRCIICGDKYYSPGGKFWCAHCPIKCENCIRESGVCTSCQFGYKEINNNGNKICVSCSLNGNCFSCDSNENESQRECAECSSGYYLDNNTCLTCANIPSCVKCSTTTNECYSCDNDLISNTTRCISCDTGKVKTNEKTCSECYLVIEKCQLCEYNNGNPICSMCYSPYVVENGKCVLSYSKTTHFDYETKSEISNDIGCLFQVNSLCFSCDQNFYLHENKCYPKDINCQKYSKTTCEICEPNIIITNGNCSLNEECKYQLTQNENKTCLICNNNTDCGLNVVNCKYTQNEFCYLAIQNYYTTVEKFGQTKSCGNAEFCRLKDGNMVDFVCKDNFVLTSNQKCLIDSKCQTIRGSDCVECITGNHINNSVCIDNDIDCLIQNKDVCISCNNKMTVEGKCVSIDSIQCKEFSDNICKSCEETHYKNVEGCVTKMGKYDNCQFVDVVYEICNECITPYLLVENLCVKDTTNVNSFIKTSTEYSDNCIERSSKGCLRCSDGYYIMNSICVPCKSPCYYCSNETYCSKCGKYSYATNGKCIEINELLSTCDVMMSTYDGCVACKNGYMRSSDGKQCDKCDVSCKTCSNDGDCVVCNDTYYRTPNNITKYCNPQDELTNCLNKTTSGCTQCEDGFALKDNLCYKCSENCTSCITITECLDCANDNILIDFKCVHFTQISNCISSQNSVCTKCSDGYELSSDKLECDKSFNYWLVIVLPVACVVLILLILISSIIIVINIVNKSEEKSITKNLCIFKMNRSNIVMTKIGEDVFSNKQEISFGDQNDEIDIGVESRELLCVGNGSKSRLKVQISTKTDTDKYTIRTEPQIVTLKYGFACEFEIFLTPYCTMQLIDEIIIIALDLTTGKQNTTSIKITAQTKNSTRLDYDEIIEEKKLGEGSFGIVYKGTYRGNVNLKMKLICWTNFEMNILSTFTALF